MKRTTWKYRAWWFIWRKSALSIMSSSCVIMCTVFLIALSISCGLGTWDWKDFLLFFFFFFCFFFCYFVFIFFKTFKAFPEIGLLILLVSFSIFLYLIVTSFSESRNDLCPYFSSLSANRSVKFSQFQLNFLVISQETPRPFVQISGRTANAPPKLLSIILTLLPTCAKLSSTIAVWAMITSLTHYNNVKKLVFKVRERLLYNNSLAILR